MTLQEICQHIHTHLVVCQHIRPQETCQGLFHPAVRCYEKEETYMPKTCRQSTCHTWHYKAICVSHMTLQRNLRVTHDTTRQSACHTWHYKRFAKVFWTCVTKVDWICQDPNMCDAACAKTWTCVTPHVPRQRPLNHLHSRHNLQKLAYPIYLCDTCFEHVWRQCTWFKRRWRHTCGVPHVQKTLAYHVDCRRPWHICPRRNMVLLQHTATHCNTLQRTATRVCQRCMCDKVIRICLL